MMMKRKLPDLILTRLTQLSPLLVEVMGPGVIARMVAEVEVTPLGGAIETEVTPTIREVIQQVACNVRELVSCLLAMSVFWAVLWRMKMAAQHVMTPALVSILRYSSILCVPDPCMLIDCIADISLSDLLPGNPLASDAPCNCAVDQVCLRVGRFGEFRCVDCKFRYKKVYTQHNSMHSCYLY